MRRGMGKETKHKTAQPRIQPNLQVLGQANELVEESKLLLSPLATRRRRRQRRKPDTAAVKYQNSQNVSQNVQFQPEADIAAASVKSSKPTTSLQLTAPAGTPADCAAVSQCVRGCTPAAS